MGLCLSQRPVVSSSQLPSRSQPVDLVEREQRPVNLSERKLAAGRFDLADFVRELPVVAFVDVLPIDVIEVPQEETD